jgi:hypothetical protein
MKVSWTRGSGDKVLVVAHQGAAVDGSPANETDYTANAAFRSGSQIGTGNYVVYKGTGTNVTVTGLTADTSYHFRAYEFNDTINSKYDTDAATGNPNNRNTLANAPGVPVATAATAITETGFTANWNGVAGATGYRLDVATDNGFTSFVTGYNSKDMGNTTSASVSGLTGNTTYYYRLRAQNAGGTSSNSNTISAGTFCTAPVATSATSITETGFAANWNTSTGATGYRLDVATDNGFTSFVSGYNNKDAENVTGSAISGLSACTTYYYRIRAVSNAGTSNNSNTISVTTADGTGVPADVQDAAPNNGDGNGDGIKDSLQTNVASLPSKTAGQSYLTVAITGCGQLESVATSTYASVGTPDAGYTYPFELVAFNIPCASANVRIYYHGAESLADLIYRKFGPTPSDWNTSIWYEMPDVTFGIKEIGGETVPYAEFTLTESQLGDDTLGYPIVDQGGVARANAIPTLNEWGMILLGILLGAATVRGVRRRRSV